MTVLKGIKIVEFAGIGPGPFCGMLLADLGADVIVVDRPGDVPPTAITRRGKRSIALDLKSPESIETVLRLIESTDALIEGMRPGVMERLGLGPDVCLARNPRLIYGRMTGWGQDGPLAQAAGHDNNYIALSGALWYASEAGQPPVAPPTLVGDLGGGALYLAVGILAGILNARSSGQGQVVDAAVVDGSAHLMNIMLDLASGGLGSEKRGTSLLDGPHWYSTYRCADGRDITIGALEPKFYRLLLEKLSLENDARFVSQNKSVQWPEQKQQLASLFATRSRDEWCALLEGSDACFAPVLAPSEAACHPHIAARDIYNQDDGLLQANPAPRFSNAPAATTRPIPAVGEHTEQVLAEITKAAR
ncbi:CaiB/BaiF CoA transferase family protein [Glaciimonas soli]|uniref:CoA transferase n=1 Tax=Glaciimonas soli TaxID=2590999 RepID=A0A843YWP2_9BURK|nr:CaiB/BaiF CoA-transferase family protein [Glaciimonas soli]MQR02123.1 CoA transferase [Glaciimonas soli]